MWFQFKIFLVYVSTFLKNMANRSYRVGSHRSKTYDKRLYSSKQSIMDSHSSKETDNAKEFNVYNLLMSIDRKTEMYVKFAKVMIIYQGPVTVQRLKSVSALAEKFKHSVRVISDETYKSETCKIFGPEYTEDFYNYFKSRAKKACEDGYSLIAIDQSLSNTDQIRYYFFLAQTFQYVVLPVPLLVTDRNFKGNREGQDSGDKRIYNQAESFAKGDRHRMEYPNLFKHLYCGWFLHDVDSKQLREEASLYIADCFEIQDFHEMISLKCDKDTFISYYNLDSKKQGLAQCIVKIFLGPTDVLDYTSGDEFKKCYGGMSKLYVVGFIVSPYIIAARVRLTRQQKELWCLPDDLDEQKKEPSVYLSELLYSSKVRMPDEEVALLASKSNRTIVSGNPFDDPTQAIEYGARGRSCHIILGTVKNAPPRNINYDVPFAVYRERNVVPKYSDDVKPYDLSRSLLRRIGKYWFIYLKESIVVNGFFATCCAAESNVR